MKITVDLWDRKKKLLMITVAVLQNCFQIWFDFAFVQKTLSSKGDWCSWHLNASSVWRHAFKQNAKRFSRIFLVECKAGILRIFWNIGRRRVKRPYSSTELYPLPFMHVSYLRCFTGSWLFSDAFHVCRGDVETRDEVGCSFRAEIEKR